MNRFLLLIALFLGSCGNKLIIPKDKIASVAECTCRSICKIPLAVDKREEWRTTDCARNFNTLEETLERACEQKLSLRGNCTDGIECHCSCQDAGIICLLKP